MRIGFGNVAGIALALGIIGCGGGGSGASSGSGGSGGGGGDGGGAQPITLSGFVTKAPLRNADVVVYALDGRGNRGAELGRGLTAGDGSGAFEVTLPATPAGPVLVEASGGTYSAESDAGTVSQTTPCRTVLPSVGAAPVAVNPLTDLAASRTIVLLGSGKSAAAAAAQAREELDAFFDFDSDIIHLVPSFDTSDTSAANAEALKLGMLLVALDQFAHDASPLDPDDVYASFATDFEDGVLDCDASVAAYGDLDFLDSDTPRDQLFLLTLLRSMHYAIGAFANGVFPAEFATYATDPANVGDPAIQPDLGPWYSCDQGTTLVFDGSGDAQCWDGTMAEDGAPYLGTYWVCGYGNNAVAYADRPSSCPDPADIAQMYTSVTPAQFHAVTPEVFVAQEVHLLTPEELEAMRLADMSAPLPSWATPGARLNDAQLDAINGMYSALQQGWR